MAIIILKVHFLLGISHLLRKPQGNDELRFSSKVSTPQGHFHERRVLLKKRHSVSTPFPAQGYVECPAVILGISLPKY